MQGGKTTLLPGPAEAGTSCVGPNICSVAAKPAKLHIVEMSGTSCLENENKLVLRPVEAPHSGIGFGPDTEIEHVETLRQGRGDQLPDMPPVHADIGEAARTSGALHEAEGCFKEARKASRIHFSGCHLELAVMN